MDKLSINLLPLELRSDTKRENRKKLIIASSIAALTGFIFLTLVIFGFRLYQGVKNSDLAKQTKENRDQISALKNKEELFFLLKDRVTKINSLSTQDNQSVLAFNLITFLIPGGVEVNSFSVDKTGKIALSGETNSLSLLNDFFDNLIDPKKNEGKIVSTKLESLTKNGDRIKFDVSISLTGATKNLVSRK